MAEEDCCGFTDSEIQEQRAIIYTKVIQNIENDIEVLESASRIAAVLGATDISNMSESEIELSEDELEDLVTTNSAPLTLSGEASDNQSELELDDDDLGGLEDGGEGEDVIASVEITPMTESAAAAVAEQDAGSADAPGNSTEIAAAVVADILHHCVASAVKVHVEIESRSEVPVPVEDIEPAHIADNDPQKPSKAPVAATLPRMEELKTESIVIGGRTLRARASATPATPGVRSRNSSGDSSHSQPSSRRSTAADGEVVSDRRQSRTSVESEAAPAAAEGRVLRRRHVSSDSRGGDSGPPPRKTRSVRGSSQDQEASSRESTPGPGGSGRNTPRLSPRCRSPNKLSAADSIVVNLPRKKKKKEMFDGKARAEADILKRISDLQSQGLWLGKKMTKNQEERGKYHWDFVIEEMVWLSGVVQQELKTKKMLAKKCATMVQKHFKDKEMAALRAEKAKEANLRRIASIMAREVKNFWGDVNKLFEYRLKVKLDAKKKEALDQHLNFIMDKTEKYSNLLAESLGDNVGAGGGSSQPTSGAPSRAESVMSDEVEDGDNDGEYNPDVDSDDDEETIEKEEEQTEEKNHESEINELENEADVPIEELLKKYYPEQFGNIEVERKDIKTHKNSSDDEKSDEAINKDVTEKEKVDNQPDDSLKAEVKEESQPDVKENAQADDKNDDECNDSAMEEGGRSRRKRKPLNIAEVEAKIKAEEECSKSEETPKDKTEEDKLEEYASLAATFQPTGNTLDTTTVKTKVPFLLKHTLREYQHIGLDWMVSLFERSLNGILADEMGLGKTIQTIAFLAHLASDRENWGPHLIVVPTSVMLNWEMEIKKWCPAFKVLVYYGSQKERRLKRVGWTKQNAFHICITSYKLVIQDHSSFRRFKWQYFILDEAQHIKNFKSQRWQLLLNFSSVGRLLLTGTPLQNNLMELWSLMHFLMPHVFESHRDFKEWFSNPMSGMVEGNMEYNNELVKRLHKVLRPFILRRLKSEVEKQLPKKYEHLVKCPLSKRQRYLYDDFMSRAKTREILSSGNLLSVINVLMQLRKCCNHPNLFEPRPTVSPFVMSEAGLQSQPPSVCGSVLRYDPLAAIDLATTPLLISPLETQISGYTWFRCSSLKCRPTTMLHPPDNLPRLSCPKEKIRLEVRGQTPALPRHHAAAEAPATFCHLESSPGLGGGSHVPVKHLSHPAGWLWRPGLKFKSPQGYFQLSKVASVPEDASLANDGLDIVASAWTAPSSAEENKENLKRKTTVTDMEEAIEEMLKYSRGIFSSSVFHDEKFPSLSQSRSPTKLQKSPSKRRRIDDKIREQELEMPSLKSLRDEEIMSRRKRNLFLNDRRADLIPMYGTELLELVRTLSLDPAAASLQALSSLSCVPGSRGLKQEISCYRDTFQQARLVHSVATILARLHSVFSQFVMYVPAVHVPVPPLLTPVSTRLLPAAARYPGDQLATRFQISTPDTRLIQYDCGKLQVLASLLGKLHTGGHRALIFTQMTKMLDVLEAFLNYHGYVYMRLDGSTKVETRQCLMERFNNDKKYFIFILSTRSGGVGINLTGADTVIFYDSDWNPTMDAQAQDRCHRIGQTRDVHIYRLVSERTVEENIIKKANQKKLLGDLAIEGGNFTTAFFKKSTINDLFNDNTAVTEDQLADEDEQVEALKKKVGAFENALATAEEDHDIQATKQAKAEENADENDFKEEEDQFNAVLNELKSVERYALKHLEWEQKDFAQDQLDFAQAEIDARKEEFDAGKLDELTQEMREELGLSSEEDEDNANTDEGSEAAEDDFVPDGEDNDDEVTIEKDEKHEQKDEFEINMLETDAEIPVEDLLRMYYPDQWKQMQGDGEETGEAGEAGENGEESRVQVNGRRSTRSRGNVEINLWELENPEDQLRSNYTQ